MKRLVPAAAAAVLPSQLLAHGAEDVFHLHPHGGEALLVLLTLVAALVIWRLRRS